jgi:hypothetical protein
MLSRVCGADMVCTVLNAYPDLCPLLLGPGRC